MKSEIKSIVANSSFLSLLQICNYILPFVLFPYLTHIMGTEHFGIWMLALSIIQYFNILIDYGFNLSATRKVALYNNNKEKVSELFTSVMFVKFLFFMLIFLFVCLFRNLLEDLLQIPAKLMLEMFIYLFGLILTPFWLFQGLEKLKHPTILSLIARLISMLATFFLINNPEDIFILPIINGIPLVITGLIAWLVLYKEGIKISIPEWGKMKNEVISGADLFISSISVTLYTTLNPIILGIFAGPQSVAYYSICEKIIQAIKSVLTPIYQAIYPYMVKSLNKKQEISTDKLRVLFILSGSLGAIIYLGLTIFNDFIYNYFFHGNIIDSFKYTLLFMSFIPLLSFMNNSIFIQTLVPLGESKYLRIVTLLAGVINILFVFAFTSKMGSIGSSLGYVLAEFTVLILGMVKIYSLYKKSRGKGGLTNAN
ncbi:flippase [[Brevibacterium] frigoritolerans]|nr:flippase [Peribacillus frigoritolerans]